MENAAERSGLFWKKIFFSSLFFSDWVGHSEFQGKELSKELSPQSGLISNNFDLDQAQVSC